jgi:hypothetical protein
LLVAGVAYQVVPMFQITPPYPSWLTGICPLDAGGAGAVVGCILEEWPMAATRVAGTALAVGLIVFAATTLAYWGSAAARSAIPP